MFLLEKGSIQKTQTKIAHSLPLQQYSRRDCLGCSGCINQEVVPRNSKILSLQFNHPQPYCVALVKNGSLPCLLSESEALNDSSLLLCRAVDALCLVCVPLNSLSSKESTLSIDVHTCMLCECRTAQAQKERSMFFCKQGFPEYTDLF